MQKTIEDYDLIINILLDNCNKEFHKTQQSDYMKEKLKVMEENCKTMVAPSEMSFVKECFCTIGEIESAKIEHAYKQGYKDCIYLLKKLEIL